MPETTTQEAEKVQKPRDVTYANEFGAGLDELPAGAAQTRTSPLQDALSKIAGDSTLHGKWHPIASYGNGGGASSSLQNLRRNHGYNPSYKGWEFASAQVEDNGNKRTVLFAKHNPAMVTSNGKQEQEAELLKRKNSGRGRPKSKAGDKAKANA